MTKEQIEFRNKLFPNGQPTPEEFIQKLQSYVLKEWNKRERINNKKEKVHSYSKVNLLFFYKLFNIFIIIGFNIAKTLLPLTIFNSLINHRI